MVRELDAMLLLRCKDREICKYLVLRSLLKAHCWRKNIKSIAARSHVGWKEEQNLSYKDVETSS